MFEKQKLSGTFSKFAGFTVGLDQGTIDNETEVQLHTDRSKGLQATADDQNSFNRKQATRKESRYFCFKHRASYQNGISNKYIGKFK